MNGLEAARDSDPTVYIVDDDLAVRESLRWLIASVNLKVSEFAGAESFLEAYKPGRTGCLVTDVRMPGMSGLELQRSLARRSILLPVIIITGHGDVEMAVRAMKAGAFDFIEKPFKDQEILDLVQNAVQENIRAVAERAQQDHIMGRMNRLTPRERQVLGMIVAGEANKGIAYHLGISDKTVEVHRARVMEKMQAKSLAELMKMVMVLEDY